LEEGLESLKACVKGLLRREIAMKLKDTLRKGKKGLRESWRSSAELYETALIYIISCVIGATQRCSM